MVGPLPGPRASSSQRAVLLTFSRCPRELEEAILVVPSSTFLRARGVPSKGGRSDMGAAVVNASGGGTWQSR